MIKIDEAKVKQVCAESKSMMEACSKLGLHFNTFKRKALKAGCYNTNQGLKGSSKPKLEGCGKIPLRDILNGKRPQYPTLKLKIRLLKEGIKTNNCEICKHSTWNNKPLCIELHHINGVRTDHRLENLQMICPNCHSQTNTFRSKNKSLVREI